MYATTGAFAQFYEINMSRVHLQSVTMSVYHTWAKSFKNDTNMLQYSTQIMFNAPFSVSKRQMQKELNMLS